MANNTEVTLRQYRTLVRRVVALERLVKALVAKRKKVT